MPLVSAVAALLRSGMTPTGAWGRVLGVPPGPDGVPRIADLVGPGGRVPRVRWLRPLAFLSRRGQGVAVEGARAVVAAGRLAATLGTPLAPVLDRLTESLVADEEVEAERRAAVAGPRSSATLLSWLPVLGVALGTALGADPLGVVLRGGLGATSAVLGVVLLTVGRWWTRRLVRAAVTAVPDGPPGPSWRAGRADGPRQEG
ncbi:type II secretion system F family protein [Cellulomonas hominis]